MANAQSKEVNLKFAYQDFKGLEASDLFINLWTYNYLTGHLPCSNYFLNVLKEIWCPAWGDFKTVTDKIKKCDKEFINIYNINYSNFTK